MAEMVEIQDDDGSDIVQDVTDAVTVPAFEELRTLKREMEFRGSLLGKTWSELSRIMTKYQSQLIDKHEQYESNISAGEHGRLTQLESVIAKKSSDVHRLEKSVSDLERKLLEKDGEIVRLRTEVHKLRNEVSMKDSLIHKLQNQMAKEAMEYSAEINSLKEILEMENEHNTGAIGPSSMKKRRLPAASITRQTHDLAPNSDIPPFSTKNEILLESCAMNKSSTIGISAASQRVYNQSAASVNQSAFPTDIHNDGSNLDAEHDQSHESADNSFQDNQFIKLDEQEEDHQDMEDPMADLLHENNQNAAPQVLVQNVHSLTNQQQIKNDVVGNRNRGFSEYPKQQLNPNASALSSKYDMQPCPVCSKRFNTRDLRRHMRIHSGIRPYTCPVCGRTFNRKDSCDRHRRLHANDYMQSLQSPALN